VIRTRGGDAATAIQKTHLKLLQHYDVTTAIDQPLPFTFPYFPYPDFGTKKRKKIIILFKNLIYFGISQSII
jgi:hypothetical protein